MRSDRLAEPAGLHLDIRPKLRIGLLWHSARSGNLGVGALTLGNMAIARAVAEELGYAPEFTLLSMRDHETDPIVPPEVKIRTIDARALLSPAAYWRWIGELDCVLDIGAGDSFAEIYGPKRFGFLLLSKVLVILKRKPLVLSPQTIGPFSKRAYRWPASVVMRKCAAVVARDDKSLVVARQMAPDANNLLSVDVAFVLPFTNQASRRGSARPQVGLNVSGLLMEEALSGRNRFGLSYDYAAFSRQLITALQERGFKVHLVPHATSKVIPEDDDGRYIDLLVAEFPEAIRVADFANPSDAKTYLSGLDFVVAARMHCCIGAFSAGVPVVPISYSRKFDGLFGMLGYPWVAPTTGLDQAGMVQFVLEAFDKRSHLAASIEQALHNVGQRLDVYREALRKAFLSSRGVPAQ